MTTTKVGVVKEVTKDKAFVSVIGLPGRIIVNGQGAMKEGESFSDLKPNTVVTFELVSSPVLTESGQFEADAIQVTTKRILTEG